MRIIIFFLILTNSAIAQISNYDVINELTSSGNIKDYYDYIDSKFNVDVSESKVESINFTYYKFDLGKQREITFVYNGNNFVYCVFIYPKSSEDLRIGLYLTKFRSFQFDKITAYIDCNYDDVKYTLEKADTKFVFTKEAQF